MVILGKYVVSRMSSRGYREYLTDKGWSRILGSVLVFESVGRAEKEIKARNISSKRNMIIQITKMMILDSLQLEYFYNKSKKPVLRRVS